MAETVIDLIAEDKSGEVILVLNQFTPWNEPGVYDQFEKRFNGYLHIIASNALYERYPRFRGQRLLIRLNYIFEPTAEILSKLEKINDKLPTSHIRFEICQFDAKELIERSEFLTGPNSKPTLVCTYTKKLSYSTMYGFAFIVAFAQLAFWTFALRANGDHRAENMIVSGTISLLFGAMAVLSAFILSRQQPRLIIDSAGIHVPRDGVLIKWDDMTALRRRRDMWKLSYIDLYLQDEALYFKQLSPKKRFVAKLGRTRSDPTFSFIASSFDIPEERIYKTIEKYAAYANLGSRFENYLE